MFVERVVCGFVILRAVSGGAHGALCHPRLLPGQGGISIGAERSRKSGAAWGNAKTFGSSFTMHDGECLCILCQYPCEVTHSCNRAAMKRVSVSIWSSRVAQYVHPGFVNHQVYLSLSDTFSRTISRKAKKERGVTYTTTAPCHCRDARSRFTSCFLTMERKSMTQHLIHNRIRSHCRED